MKLEDTSERGFRPYWLPRELEGVAQRERDAWRWGFLTGATAAVGLGAALFWIGGFV